MDNVRKQFEEWIDHSIYANDGESFHNDLWNAYHAGRKDALEEATIELASQHTWLTSVAAANLIRALEGASNT